MVSLLITGSHSACNKGAAALVLAAARGLRQRLGDVSCLLPSPFPQHDRHAYGSERIAVIRSWRRWLPWCAVHVFVSGVRRSGPPLLLTREARATLRASLVLDVSGDGFSEDYGPPVVLSHLYPIWLALRCGRPVCLAAQTFGPFRRTRPWVRRLLDRTDLITVRDDFSLRTLADLGVHQPRIERVADLAFLLDPAPRTAVDRLAQPAPEGFWTRPVLGLTISSLGGQRSPLSRKGCWEPFWESYREGVGRFAAEHDVSILLVAHRTGPRPRHDDRPVTRRLCECLQVQQPGRVWMLDEEADAPLVKGLIGRCGMFCAQRLHSGIAALSMEVPTVMIACAPKAFEVMRQLDLTNHVIPLERFSAETLLEQLHRLWSQREAVRDHIRRTLPAIRQAAERTLDLAVDLVRERPQSFGAAFAGGHPQESEPVRRAKREGDKGAS